jgi:Fe-S-cluster containining protein
MRCPGSATTLLRMWKRADEGTGEVSVPCGSCNACCRAPNMQVALSPEEAARFGGVLGEILDYPPNGEVRWGEPLDHVPHKIGTHYLPKKDDGSCVYLIDDRCSIYETRPQSCRNYDCREGLLSGLPHTDNIMREAMKEWGPIRTPTAEDRKIVREARIYGE